MMRGITLGLAGCAAIYAMGACSTLGDVFAPAQIACEPATGQTFTARIKDRIGSVERAPAPDTRCTVPGIAAQRVTPRVMCLAADGQSLAVAWDDARNAGAVYVSSTKLPGCKL